VVNRHACRGVCGFIPAADVWSEGWTFQFLHRNTTTTRPHRRPSEPPILANSHGFISFRSPSIENKTPLVRLRMDEHSTFRPMITALRRPLAASCPFCRLSFQRSMEWAIGQQDARSVEPRTWTSHSSRTRHDHSCSLTNSARALIEALAGAHPGFSTAFRTPAITNSSLYAGPTTHDALALHCTLLGMLNES
jgi:hypothetical protein